MKFLLGTKQHMTTVFTEEGRAYAATIIVAMPAMVTQVKTKEKDGYVAAQIGAGETKETKVNQAQIGHAKGKAFRHFAEFRPRDGAVDVEAGVTLDVSVFVPGDPVSVTAISKGKGFQGVVKRHGFHGGSRTHGQKHSEREPGSIGGGGRAGGRVAKGMRMAGRMGGEQVTVRNLKVLQVHPETNEIVLSGAVPGRRGTLVEIRG
ncbi:50S ribosomal protein L3 [Candidatus Adlerbacteria bacterium RIFCSPLOWO2_01_FULL_51_16]|uniref:50S ribosomal protein L3 n=1 Tax=Candidatus Adlerbacteria bacterium RIFCSPLOWO2_01_FULL_51_16 TaxID=1797243 RepID=A0A1F4XHL5_9BACT|nr:MAG: 50S ribosomal protein L3 [Candidatus Adlerbacteria bacterium RIFCSPLOWO2_01_FULL_51_16]